MKNSPTNKLCLKPIKGEAAFSLIYKSGIKVRGNGANASFCTHSSKILQKNEVYLNCTYYGLAVSKRICRKAVVRNRIKRLIRESLRFLFNQNNEYSEIKYIIISWRLPFSKPNEVTFVQVLDIISELLKKTIKLIKQSE